MEKENLIGQIFGTIQIIGAAPNLGQRTAWHCKCTKCGAEKDIAAAYIKNGRTRSCGCGCIEDNNHNLISSSERVCAICGKTFTLGKNGHTRKYCYECSPTQAKNKDTRTKHTTTYRQSVKRALVEYKGGQCERCGYNKCINALQFHHIDPSQKDFALSKSTKSFEELKAEVDKCMLLCANCHAELHQQLFLEENISDLQAQEQFLEA